MRVTAWHEPIRIGDRWEPAGRIEIRDLARGAAGALFVSLPLLFTMEMWQLARTMPEAVLLVLLGATVLINRTFLEYSGYRKRAWQRSKWWDTWIAMGIGAIAGTITLAVTGAISLDMNRFIAIKTILIETIPMSMGAAVAVNQLGGGDGVDPDKVGFPPDVNVLVGSLLGGLLFSFNIAPTQEIRVIVLDQAWWQVGLTFLISLGVSYLMVAVAQFEERDLSRRTVIDREWLEALMAYIVAFAVSFLLLWSFGYLSPLDPIAVWLPQTIALAYATTLGGAAGRLVL